MGVNEMIKLEQDNFLKTAKALVLEIMEKKKADAELTKAEEEFKEAYLSFLLNLNAKPMY